MSSQTWLIHMSEHECASRLTESQLGRLGVIVGGRPEVFPVNYVVDDDGFVAFPTQPGTKLESALDWPWVGFEIDGINATSDEGWSVMIVGKAEEIVDEACVTKLVEQRQVPWRKSGSERWLRLVPAKVTGRKIRATS